ncbi:hypothetical protein [Streptomyces sp. NPDC056105]|uniref:hypothetical protein n=1 Tax=Streptomyces sp. NPDC056105 TaxID=3345714 RepID=UPI0035E2F6B0
MAKDGWTEGTDNSAETSGDLVDEPSGVQLTYRPQLADTRVGQQVRDRVKRTKSVLRGVLLVLGVGFWLITIDVVSTGLLLFVVLWMWGYPRLHVAYIQRIIGWQVSTARPCLRPGSPATATTARWSRSGGYRETAHHFVLLSRDPNIMWLEVVPKRGVHEAEDLDRLRAILDQNTTRV